MAHHDRSCPACQDTVKWTASPHGPARPARSYPPVSSSMASWASSEILNKNGGFIRKINHKEIAGFSSKPGFFWGSGGYQLWRETITSTHQATSAPSAKVGRKLRAFWQLAAKIPKAPLLAEITKKLVTSMDISVGR